MTHNRREFLAASAALSIAHASQAKTGFDLYAYERGRVLKAATAYLTEKPVTVTAARAERSAGGLHDYFSEGDYWWPDPKDPDGPYIQRDGMSNPNNFSAHRHALIRLSVQVPALCAAWLLTKGRKFADHAAEHLRAWFIRDDTRMNPNLQYAQAIHGRTSGRGTGIIDTLQLIEVVRGASRIEPSDALSPTERELLRKWFADYLNWMTTSKNGQEERDAKNNHGTCWVTQVAEFATYTRNQSLREYCRTRYKTVLVPSQIAPDGSFPLELRRTKPYSYSLFNLEVLAGVCQILSDTSDKLWNFATPDGRGIGRAIAFMYPYIADKKKWPYPPDVMYFDQWPLREQSLLFAGLALRKSEYLALWRTLNPDPTIEEAIRNFPFRQPVLWIEAAELASSTSD
jgi:hypothetical protein